MEEESLSLALQVKALQLKLDKQEKLSSNYQKGNDSNDKQKTNSKRIEAFFSETMGEDKSVWLADSGPSLHITFHRDFFSELRPVGKIKRHKMGDRYNIHSQLEHLQSKYIGTGHADTTKFEWLVNQHRDSYASYMGHFDLLNFFAISENEAKARVRFNLMERMLQPCGPPPEKPED
uniref:Splicing factor 3B subunit 5 n=2 Tax=Timema TaxID=61471 RepID=A0A7R9DLG0_TIMPO|nr:unnamed protein product [Timema poppensis]